jgi:hypothetical protein
MALQKMHLMKIAESLKASTARPEFEFAWLNKKLALIKQVIRIENNSCG